MRSNMSRRQSGYAQAKNMRWLLCGEIIPDLKINGHPAPYPVVNERAVRATAGLMLIAAVVAFSLAYFMNYFLPLKIITPIFLVDFTARVFTGVDRFSPFGMLGTMLVRNQKPEWVGAAQKRFAWTIGIAVALFMTVITNMNITGVLPLSFCMMCISLMWMEATLGVCVGCVIYKWFVKHGVMKSPEYYPACPGGVCDSK
jgi:hypothetical protein